MVNLNNPPKVSNHIIFGILCTLHVYTNEYSNDNREYIIIIVNINNKSGGIQFIERPTLC